jgi:hypothetical protein
MTFNKTIRTSVGADVSRPPPIGRPALDFTISGLFCVNLSVARRSGLHGATV